MLTGLVLAEPVCAQDFPTHPVTIVVPTGPGGVAQLRADDESRQLP